MFLRFLAKTAEGFTNELATKAGKTYSLISYSIARLLLTSTADMDGQLKIDHREVIKTALIGNTLTETIGKEADFNKKFQELLRYWKTYKSRLIDSFKLSE